MPAPRRAPKTSRPTRPRRRLASEQPPAAPAQRGVRLTARDMEMLRWITRHGIVYPDLIAERFFARDSGAPGKRAAYRRIAKLEQLGLLQRDWIVFNSPKVIRATRDGARLANVGLEPANLVLAEVNHALNLVNVTEHALAAQPKGWTLLTERELRAERYRRMRRGESPKGRVPDGLLVGPRGQRIAIEVDQTSKRSRNVEEIIADYRYGDYHYDKILWYAPGARVADRVREIVEENQAADLIEVRTWR